MARMFNPDGSCPIDELTYREAQGICKMLGLKAIGRRKVLEDRLNDYEDEKDIRLKIYIHTIVGNGNPPSNKEYSYKVMEIANNE
ncbi:MAG: SAP domain-containing protein [Cyanobacteria bacterium P01_G01_bin.39]